MTITLGGITLPDLWFDPDMQFGAGVDGRMVVARSGTPIVFEQATGFRNADLIGSADMAWMTLTQMQAVDALVLPGADYSLSYEGSLYTCRFRTWDVPVILGAPVVPRPNPDSGDYYRNVRIKLILT